MSKQRVFGLIGLFALVSGAAIAEPVTNTWPVAKYYPEPVALLYPGFNVAAGVNAAALPGAGSGTALQFGFSPAPSGADSRAFTSVAHKQNNFAYGAGYQGNLQNSTIVHNLFAGLGANFNRFNVGFALRDYNLSTGFNPSVDASMVVELKIVDIGIVFYDLQASPRVGIGIGSRSGQRFSLEANILMPPFNNLTSSYLATVSGQLAVDMVNAYFRTSYDTGAMSISHTLGMGVWAGQNIHLGLQVSTPNRVGAALTVAF